MDTKLTKKILVALVILNIIILLALAILGQKISPWSAMLGWVASFLNLIGEKHE